MFFIGVGVVALLAVLYVFGALWEVLMGVLDDYLLSNSKAEAKRREIERQAQYRAAFETLRQDGGETYYYIEEEDGSRSISINYDTLRIIKHFRYHQSNKVYSLEGENVIETLRAFTSAHKTIKECGLTWVSKEYFYQIEGQRIAREKEQRELDMSREVQVRAHTRSAPRR